MSHSYYYGQTLDDLMRCVIEAILVDGNPIEPTKGPAIELSGVLLEIENPRARISRTETRGKPFSCLGELCWYLARSDESSFISYYLSKYDEFAENNLLYGGYGPRMFDWEGIDQVQNVTERLRNKPTSRKAVIQIFDRSELVEMHKDISCTCTLQFMIRNNKLLMFTNMRSNDIFLGLPHDVFSFTMIQEIIARDLSVEIGSYKHAVGSLHLYDRDIDETRQFIDEGWQSSQISMPPMPIGDPWPAINSMLVAEKQIRTEEVDQVDELSELDQYWADLIRLLQVYRYHKDGNADMILDLCRRMSTDVYRPFIEKKAREI